MAFLFLISITTMSTTGSKKVLPLKSYFMQNSFELQLS